MLKLNFKMRFINLTILLLCLAAPAGLSAEIADEGTAARKLQRGFLNIVLSPMEFSTSIQEANQGDYAGFSWVYGTITGVFETAARALVGVYELVTAPFPIPANYKPVLSPEFPWQYLPETPPS